jgi:hypothetical protein
VPISRFYEHHHARRQLDLAAVDGRDAAAVHNVQPLIGTLVKVVQPSFRASGRQDHHGTLRLGIPRRKPEAGPEIQLFFFHLSWLSWSVNRARDDPSSGRWGAGREQAVIAAREAEKFGQWPETLRR